MKYILISGAGSGLGLELSLQYSKLGYTILLLGRTPEKLYQVEKMILKSGGQAVVCPCDICSEESLENLLEHIKEYTPIECLINNAGVGFFGPLKTLSHQDLNTMIDTNVKGTILLTQKLLPLITGRIINIISTAGLKGKVNEAAYVASKFAVRGFTESLQAELSIAVTAVYMGGMNTPFWTNSTHIKDKARLKSPLDVAKEIISKDDGRLVITINK